MGLVKILMPLAVPEDTIEQGSLSESAKQKTKKRSQKVDKQQKIQFSNKHVHELSVKTCSNHM